MAEVDDWLPEDKDPLRDALLSWYERNRRPFPWRDTTDPYAILVCEVMSQQTQLERVEDAWEAFLERWPTVEALADADRAAVVGFWSANRLGYNNRARYLHDAANRIVSDHGGQVPADPEVLETLPGVGPYTADAVASFAFNAGDAVVDTNVKRVLYRVIEEVRDAEDPPFDSLASALMPDGRSRDWNNAIMELGGVVCRKTPRCDDEPCPWRAWCHAYRTGDFTAPDVPTQPEFEGSRRQFRGRIVRILEGVGELGVDELGPRVRVDYTPESNREWLLGLLSDLADDGLVEIRDGDADRTVRLRR